ncbi:hypothetical protein [Paenibacillus eucommiae]|uniref:Glycosyl hydrolase 109 C-terminal domain-containing protein n=1 Tax=Paenibacillus eucommiae TaxID=1355755 RepID=A0ABS4J8X4_9BACL|nr:hypothetical protein [Paenibacillus eucommiae]MBP1996291.1 hypothetical protein [Paenibacillus eucommiae]
MEDCWELVETVEQTGMTNMMAENFCYSRTNIMVRHMVETGAFGELTHAECGYGHDVRNSTHDSNGNLLWRGKLLQHYNGNNYPPHSLEPVSQWLGINRSDSFDYIMTIVSKTAYQSGYFNEIFGPSHPGAQPDYWKQGIPASL